MPNIKKVSTRIFPLTLIYQRNGVHYFTLSCIPVDKRNYFKLIGNDFGEFFFFTEGIHLVWAYEKDWLFREGGRIAKDLMSPKGKRNFKDKWQGFSRACYVFVRKFLELDLKKKSDNGLKALFKELIKYMVPFMVFTVVAVDFLDEVIFHDLKEELGKKVKNNFDEVFIKITTAIEPTYMSKMDLSLLEIARAVKKDKNLANVFKNKNLKEINKYLESEGGIAKMIAKHQKEFWWARLGWAPQATLNKQDIIKEIKEKIQEKRNIEKEIKDLHRFSERTKKEKFKLIKRLNLTGKRFKKLLQLFEDMAVYHDWRKEGQMKMLHSAFRILRELARRDKRLAFEDLLWYSHEDVFNYLDKGAPIKKSELARRKQAALFYANSKKTALYFGQKARQKQKDFLGKGKNGENIKEFKGVVAYRGKVRGRARVSHSAKELNQTIKSGDILVTSMTTPDFVPAMKKAGAIITDEGGITCHAAIISRELEIPCIVGTKIATKVLRDGDEVEVDAERGIVKIIKKAKN